MPIRYEPMTFVTFQAEMGTFEHVFVTPTEYVVDVPIWEPETIKETLMVEMKKDESRFVPDPDWYDNYLRAREPDGDKEEER